MLVAGHKKHRKRGGKVVAGHGREAPGGVGPLGGDELCDMHPQGIPRAPRLVHRRQRHCHRPSHMPIQSSAPTPMRTPPPLPLTPLCVR
ncbi:hypothetical protein TIFTF001_010222 [Ficus carica]|uniref:Uncharacterized protein n=1 Tax=Ficus carica TaxID=3494 RepID=A0AA88CZM0_FICCA|nr:hypothetical protein TIFTF001_010222 [Ficus carica]